MAAPTLIRPGLLHHTLHVIRVRASGPTRLILREDMTVEPQAVRRIVQINRSHRRIIVTSATVSPSALTPEYTTLTPQTSLHQR